MCVQDYLTWVTVKRDFSTMIRLEQVKSHVDRSKALGIIDRDETAIVIAERQYDHIEKVDTAMKKRIASITESSKSSRDAMYVETIRESLSIPSPANVKQSGRVDTIRKIQAVDLCMNLMSTIAVSKAVVDASSELECLKDFYRGGLGGGETAVGYEHAVKNK